MRGTDPTKSTWVYPKFICKFVNFFTNILICYNYIYNYTVIVRLNSICIFYLSKILTIWKIVAINILYY